ncbi:MAG: queuosine precursor transporter [Verrucomicrobia bacterium]|nr:queuosine precursor transporter [Verrucomicrobiota bacterium]MBS0647441.1 queuosine precursor transporter [Verrucomicrobiota bacterium]
MFSNLFILFLHSAGISILTLAALALGKEAIKIWLTLLVIGMNLFVLKQIKVFGLHVTCSDALAVGYLLGLNLIQEFFGRKEAMRTIWITCFASLAFLFLSFMTLVYQPSDYDQAHSLLYRLFFPQLRLVIASLVTFLIVQLCDINFFSLLREKAAGRWLTARITLSLLCAQTLDTVLFSYLGLYGIVPHIQDIIVFSLLTKWLVIVLSSPYAALSRRMIRAF